MPRIHAELRANADGDARCAAGIRQAMEKYSQENSQPDH